MHNLTCSSCPFWKPHEKAPVENLGRCYGNPPQIVIVPRVQQVDKRSAIEVLRNPDQPPQQTMLVVPEAHNPDTLGYNPACHLHPDAPLSTLIAAHMKRAMNWLDRVEAMQKEADEAQAKMVANWNRLSGDKPN